MFLPSRVWTTYMPEKSARTSTVWPDLTEKVLTVTPAGVTTPCSVVAGFLSEYACPSELAHQFLKQVSVSDGNSDTDRFTLIATLSDIGCIQIVLSLKVHPDVGGYTQCLLQSQSYVK